MKSIVVAYDKKFGIGANNDLLWQRNLPADLEHFKNITSGGAIIMGKNTYKSIGRLLPNRQNIIVSSSIGLVDGATVVDSLEKAYDMVDKGRETYIIGGGQIFAAAFNGIDRIYATEVNKVFDSATVFFPVISSDVWREISREKHTADEKNLYDYDFVVYDRITK